MDNKPVIASTLTGNELARAFTAIVAERWDNWDISPFMVYLVDVCAPSILPYLADQFDIEGIRGFEIAEDETQKRELIKKSIALHKYMGTPWAIREACRTVGFPVIILEEGVTELDGIARPEDWARFRLFVHAGENRYVKEEEIRKLLLFIDSYKNERSHLVDFGLYQSFADTISPECVTEQLDVFTTLIQPNPVTLNPAGKLKTVSIRCNTSWKIGEHSGLWEDGSGDGYQVQKTGENQITVTSGENTTGDRTVSVPIVNEQGLLLDRLQIIQHLKWYNAYSYDYSRAYNLNPNYLRVSPLTLPFPAEGGTAESEVEASVSWRIDIPDMSLEISAGTLHIPAAGGTVQTVIKANTDWKII